MNTFKSIIFTSAIAWLGIFWGCAPQSEKEPLNTEEKAEERVEEAREELKDAKAALREARKAERADYWEDRERFKSEYDSKIKENDNKIAELRANLKKDDKDYAAKNQEIGRLEERNSELKRRLDEYDDSQAAARWEEFKREFKNDMDNLGESIKGIFKDDVK